MNKKSVLSTLCILLGIIIWIILKKTAVVPEGIITEHSSRVRLERVTSKPITAISSWNWETGSSVSYDFTNSTLLSLDAEQHVSATVSGCWHVLVMDDGRTDGTVELATIFTNARYTTGNSPAVYYGQLLEQVPCVLQMTVEGKILGTAFPTYLQAIDRQILAGLSAVHIQLARPDKAGFWTAEEEDLNGTVGVRYRIIRPGTILKQRIAFSHLNAQGIGPDAALRITASDFTASLGTMWLQSFEGQEAMEFINQGQCLWRSHQEVKLIRRAEEGIPDLLARMAQFPTADAALADLGRDLPPVMRLAGSGSITDLETAAARAAQYANVDFETMMKSFNEAMAAAKGHADRQPAIESLRDWLLARPEEAAHIKAHLSNRTLTEESTGCIIHALKLSSASPASQAVLAAVLGDAKGETYSPAVLVQAASAAGGVGEITDQALMDSLYLLAFPGADSANVQASDSAQLSLGLLARTNPAISDRLAAELEHTLNIANTAPDELVSGALLTLTNGKIHNDALNNAATRLFASNERVRSDALAYLYSTDDSCDAVAALADQSMVVQTRALELLTGENMMPPSRVAAVIGIMRDPSANEAVRSTAA